MFRLIRQMRETRKEVLEIAEKLKAEGAFAGMEGGEKIALVFSTYLEAKGDNVGFDWASFISLLEVIIPMILKLIGEL